jgi:hypothetical protein
MKKNSDKENKGKLSECKRREEKKSNAGATSPCSNNNNSLSYSTL